jgi:apolipoprotein N-acyltransferase
MRLIPLRLWAIAIFSGILQVLPFPIAGPTPLWRTAFCWVAILPLLWALLSNDRSGKPLTLRQAAYLGYVCGFVWYMGNCYWIYQTMYLYGGLAKPIAAGILVLFCLYLGLYHALFGTLIAAFRNRFGRQTALLLVPFAWVAVELARARITGLPWDLLGIAQVDNPLLTRLAPVTGAYGLSFVIAAVNALWLIRIRIRERRFTRPALTIAGVVIVVLYTAGLRLIADPKSSPTTARATLVQENLGVGAEARGNNEPTSQMVDSFSRLSLYPPADRCNGIPELPSTTCIQFLDKSRIGVSPIVPTDLIAWPESPAGFRTDDPLFRERLAALARAASAPLVIGSLGVVPDGSAARGVRVYDSAALVTADGISAGRYDKIHLVPWGEYVPFKKFFSFADKLTAGAGNMDRGTDRTIFRTAEHNFGVFICYESIFGDEVRQFVKNGAEVLVNISDDGWYGDTSAAWQHLNMVRMRAIENHRWILRSTNTGVTAAIDPYGHVTVAAPRHIRTALRAGFNFEHSVTFYTIHGDLFAYACAFIAALALVFSLIGRAKNASAPRPASKMWIQQSNAPMH